MKKAKAIIEKLDVVSKEIMILSEENQAEYDSMINQESSKGLKLEEDLDSIMSALLLVEEAKKELKTLKK